MKKLLSFCCAFEVLLSYTMPVQAAATDTPEQYDIAAYVEEHFRRADGTAVHFLDPTGWYGSEITELPDIDNHFGGLAFLYADDLGEAYRAGDFAGSLLNGVVYSDITFEFAGKLSEQEIAAFQSVLEECAASRDTLVASSYIPAQGFQPFLRDFALRKDTPDALTAALNANPEVKALISKISYKPVVFSDANITTDEGLRFMTTAGDTLEAGQLRTLAAEKGMSWTVTDQGEVIPETVTAESLVGVLDTVCGAFEVMLKPSSLAASSLALQNDDARVLYQKEIEIGDVDGDGRVTAFDASLALTGFNEATVMDYEPEERTLSPAQEQTADVDGDGVLTAFDATCILTYTNLKYNAGFDDLTWADVLPNP